MKAKSKTYVTSANTMFAALSILQKNGGTMPIRILMKEVEKALDSACCWRINMCIYLCNNSNNNY